MLRTTSTLLLACLAVFTIPRVASGQKFIPKSIQFQGAPEYSDSELLAAAGLKKGMLLDYATMNAISKKLMDTGVFATLLFKFDGQDLIFMMTPSTELYPMQLDNLPLGPESEVEAKLHEQLPLFHGKVPTDGGLEEEVRAALEKMLEEEGLQATVIKTTAADLATQKVNGVDFSISMPAVAVKVDDIEGVSDANESAVKSLAHDAGNEPFDRVHTAGNLERLVEQSYNDKGYAGAKIQVERDGNAVMNAGAIVVPFSLKVTEGKVYSVKSIQVPTGTPVTQAEIDKILTSTSGAATQGVKVRSVWILISKRYKENGYLDCKITPRPALDDAAGTVSYTVDIDPGAVYHLGFVKFDNVSDDLRTSLIHNWQMMPGDVFNESYVADFLMKAQAQDPVLRRSLAGVKVSYDAMANPQTHVVNLAIRLER